MTKTLQMVFQNQSGNNVTISLPDVKEDLTAENIKAVMNTIIAKNVFQSSGGDLVGIMSASIVSREVSEFNVR
ncbi:MAG: DUF2922 domain-containing protein [Caloramator sp.]|nr:DUF2922 domain-containing protein [Caloramator sp.]